MFLKFEGQCQAYSLAKDMDTTTAVLKIHIPCNKLCLLRNPCHYHATNMDTVKTHRRLTQREDRHCCLNTGSVNTCDVNAGPIICTRMQFLGGLYPNTRNIYSRNPF